MKVKVKIVNKDIDQNRVFEVLEEHTNCYILKYDDGKFLTVKKEWCEIVKEDKTEAKTIRITKDLNVIKLFKGDILTAEMEESNRYLLIHSGVFKRICIKKDCFEYVEKETFSKTETVEKDIELPNEFYFKYHTNRTCKFKAILNNKNMYRIYRSLDNEYYCSYKIDSVKNNIENKKWIIVDKPVDSDFNKDNIVKGREQQKQVVNKNNDILEQMKKENDIKFASFNKKTIKFIELTTIEGFKVTIAKDKIVSVLQYEDKCFITTVAIEGTFTVIELAEDIIKILEE